MNRVPYQPGDSGKPNPPPIPGSSPPITPKGPHLLASGSYYLESDELILQARLNDYDTGELLFAFKPLHASRGNLSPALDELSKRVVAAAAAQRDPNIDIRLMNPPASYEAYAAYAKAYEEWGVDRDQTIVRLQTAVDLDPEFHVARFFLLKTCGQTGQRERLSENMTAVEERFGQLTPFERTLFKTREITYNSSITTAEERINVQRRLVTMAPHLKANRINLPNRLYYANRPREALEVLAPLLPTFKPDSHPSAWEPLGRAVVYHHMLSGYDQEFEWASIGLERFPDVGNFYIAKGRALAALGRTDEVLEVIEACTRIELRRGWKLAAMQAGEVMATVGLELRVHGHNREGDQLLEQAADWYAHQAASVEPANRDLSEIVVYGWVLRAAGRWIEARGILEDLEQGGYSPAQVAGALGVIAAATGDMDEAHRRFEGLDPKTDRNAQIWRVRIATHLGEKERAVDLFREYLASGRGYRLTFHYDVDLEPLWDYPPFQELIAPKG